VRVNHPFHLWHGQQFLLVGVQRQFLLVGVRRNWSEDRAFFFDDQGVQQSLPVGWTDAAGSGPVRRSGGWPVPIPGG
jgi:Family of unknown function (DUF5372)